MENSLFEFYQALINQQWLQAWQHACRLPAAALAELRNNPEQFPKFDDAAEAFVQQLLLPQRRLLEFMAHQLPTTDDPESLLEPLLAHYAHPSLRRECFCPHCAGERAVHAPRLFQLARAAAQLAQAWRQNDPNTAASLFCETLRTWCNLFLDTTALSVAAAEFPAAWFRDALQQTDDLTARQRLALLADLTHWFLTGRFLSLSFPRSESRASVPLVALNSTLPAQFRVVAALADVPGFLYPDPLMLLNTTYDASFAEQLRLSWEAAVQLALPNASAPALAVRWRLTNFRAPDRWNGGSVGDNSAGGAMLCALAALLNPTLPPVDDSLFISLALRQGSDRRLFLGQVGGVDAKVHLLTQDACRGCRLVLHSDNRGRVAPEFPRRDSLVFLDSSSLGALLQCATGLTAALQNHLSRLQDDLNRIDWAARKVNDQYEPLTLDAVFVEPHLQIRKPAPQPERPDQQTPTERPEHAREQFPTRDYIEEALAQLYELLPHSDRYITETVRWQRFCTETLKPNAHTALVGSPGSGKTTASRSLARELALQALQQLTQGADLRELTLPLWAKLSAVRLPRTARAGFSPPEDTAITRLLEAAGVPSALRTFYTQQLKAGQVVVFLDGLDELGEQQEPEFKAWLRALHTALPHAPLLITCRTLNWEGGRERWVADLKIGEPYELAPLNPQEQRAFVQRFFEGAPERASSLQQLLERSFALRHVARTFLVLTLIALLHNEREQSREEGRPDGGNPQQAGEPERDLSIAGVYRAVLRNILLGKWRLLPSGVVPPARDETEAENLITRLLKAGYELFKQSPNGNWFTQRDWEVVLKDDTAQLVRQLLAVGFLVEAGRNKNGELCYSVMHRSFLEFLAGAHLASQPRAVWEPVLKGTGEGERLYEGAAGTVHRAPQGSWLWFAPEYQEVLAFMASAMDDATPLLEAIEAEEQRFPREVSRHLLVHKARVAGYGKVEPRKREAIVQEVVRLYFENEHPPLRYVLPALRALGQYAVNALIQRLQDRGERWHVRAAAWALGLIGDARAVDALIQRLQDQDEDGWVRKAAAEALGQIRDARAVDALIERLQDQDEYWEVRAAAARALGQIRDARAVDALIERLQDQDEYWEVRAAAAEALGQIRDARAVDALLQRLLDEDWFVRAAAAEALEQICDARAVDALLQRLLDEDWFVRAAAAEALGQIRDARAVDALLQRLLDEDWFVRAAAARALGQIRDARAVDALIERLQDQDEYWEVRAAAAEALGQIRDARAVDTLIQRLQDRTEDVRVRAAAAEALEQIRDARAVDALIQRLQDRTEDVRGRYEAAAALGRIGDARAVDALIQRLQDRTEDVRVRYEAARALGQIRDARAVDALIQRLQDRTEDVRVRAAAVEALGQIRDARAVDALIQRLQDQDEDEWVRKAAAAALGRIGDARAVDALLQRLQEDDDADVREAAAEALGWIGDARAVDALTERLQDRTEDVMVRKAAAEALGRIDNALAVSRLIPLLQEAWDREWAYETLYPICRKQRVIVWFPLRRRAQRRR